jgi:hypothetical protein
MCCEVSGMPLEFYGTLSVSVARMGAHLIAEAASDLNAKFDRVLYGRIAHRHFDDIICGISILIVLFLIASVIAVSFYYGT